MFIRPITTALLVTAGVALAARGGNDPDPSADRGSNDRQEREAALNYARCMRGQGIDMPDPQIGEDGTITQAGPEEVVDADEMQAAQRACRQYRDSGGRAPSEDEREEQREMLERAVAYAECMREEGIKVPDPTSDEDGKNLIMGGGGLDRDAPDFTEADETCRSKVSGLPAAPPSQPGGGQDGKP
jgi:hypothetical protein